MPNHKKHVFVLAHADGWGALSANTLIRHIHEHYPDIAIHLIVSQATKNKEGKIATKLEDLKDTRELKESNLLEYFAKIDALPASQKAKGKEAELYTFNELARRFCADAAVHYTSRGGPKGGQEVAEIFHKLEGEDGITPEVVLSVDTMAILPEAITSRYHCFSTHPGPLDTIKVEGMQGTLRSLVSQVFYDRDGNPKPSDPWARPSTDYIKGTLFLQHPELDKGPPIDSIITPVCPGMCAYQARDEVYSSLVASMIDHLPIFLDKNKREALAYEATAKKEALDKLPHISIPELDDGQFKRWQSQSVAFLDDTSPQGLEVIQNEIVSPHYFQNAMRRFWPGNEKEFKNCFDEIYGNNIERIKATASKRLLDDPWAAYHAGDPRVAITRLDPETGEPLKVFSNMIGPIKVDSKNSVERS